MTTVNEPLVSTLRSQRRGPTHLIRVLGPTAPERMTTQPDALTSFLERENGLWRWQSGEGGTAGRRYEVPASADPLLGLCFIGSVAHKRRRTALLNIGAALARLHNEVPVAALSGSSPALRRLAWFLTSSTPSGPANRDQTAHPVVTRRRSAFLTALRPGLAQELVDDCQNAMASSTGVFSHGWLGLDKWFTSPHEGIGLIGEDIGVAPREHDLGSIFAQILEYHHLTSGLISQADLERDKFALLTGYGNVIDEAWFSREVRLAITRHIADYAVHTRGPETEMVRYAHLISTLDTTARTLAAQ